MGIKDLNWQNSKQTIQMHHNYSKVSVQQPDENNFGINLNFNSNEKNEETSNFDQTEDLDQIKSHNSNQFEYFNENNYGQNKNSFGQNENIESFEENPQKTIKTIIKTTSTAKVIQTINTKNAREVSNLPLDHQRIRINPNVDEYRVQEIREPKKLVLRQHRKIPEIYNSCPEGASGQFAYKLSCHQFLNCWKGRGFVQNCAPGTLFNPLTSECDYADKVSCVRGLGRNSFQHEKSAALKQVKCPESYVGIIPDYSDCSKFINCNNGIEYLMDCPPDTLFDVKKNMCDFPNRATCVFKEDETENFDYGNLIDVRMQPGKFQKYSIGNGREGRVKGHYIFREDPSKLT